MIRAAAGQATAAHLEDPHLEPSQWAAAVLLGYDLLAWLQGSSRSRPSM
jgi:hypothetical protein